MTDFSFDNGGFGSLDGDNLAGFDDGLDYDEHGQGWWPSDEHLDAQRATNDDIPSIPEMSDWHNVTSPVSVTVDQARQELWEQGRREISWIQDNIHNHIKLLPNVSESAAADTMSKLYHFLLGPHSRLGEALRRSLMMSVDKYNCFLHTYITTLMFNCGISILKKDDKGPQLLMNGAEYNRTWQKIAVFGHDGGNPLWMAGEDAYNKVAHELFMNRDRDEFTIVLEDNNKLHVCISL